MGTLHQAFKAEMARIPSMVLGSFISEKLKVQGLGDVPGLAEALTEHLLNGNKGSFDWGNNNAGDQNISLEFTIEDADKIEILTKEFLNKIPQIVEESAEWGSKSLLRALKRDWHSQALHENAELDGFKTRLHMRWGYGFELLRMLLTICRELGAEYCERLRKSRSGKKRNLRTVLVRLHGRACQVAAEISTLMDNGFADGAMARWRTLYEIGIVAAVIAEGGDELAQRYIEYDLVESKSALDEYDRCHVALGYRPVSKRDRLQINFAYDKIVHANGPEFAKQYGWASTFLRKKKVTFRELEEAADKALMRSHYKMASQKVHAGSKGIFHQLGVESGSNVVLSGPSDVGFAEPGQNCAIALVQITVILLSERRGVLDVIVMMKVLLLLQDEIIDEFVRVERSLTRDRNKERLRKR
jgi:hypothetical protein